MRIPGASLAPIVDTPVAAELIERVRDPIRENRPTYHPADPLIRFHCAVIRRLQSRLSRHGADTMCTRQHVLPTFDSQVVGPCFEAAARYWTTHFAEPDTVGGHPDHVGPTTVMLGEGVERQVDVLVAADDGDVPSVRTVLALGEAKAGELITDHHLRRLETVRATLGERAARAELLLFGA